MASKKNLREFQDEFVSLYKEGMSIRAIALKYGVSKTGVAPLIKEKIELRPKSSIKERDEKIIIESYLKGLSVAEICNLCGYGDSIVRRFLQKQKGVKMRGAKKYEDLITNFINEYKEGFSLEQIAKKYGVSRQTVLTYLNEEDVNTRTYVEAGNKFECEETYFDQLDDYKAEILGEIFALSTISKSVGNREFINVKIQVKKEKELVELIRNFFDKTEENVEYGSKNGLVTTASIRIFNDYLIAKLREYCIELDKPNVPKEYIDSFYKGYFKHELTVTQKNIEYINKAIEKRSDF